MSNQGMQDKEEMRRIDGGKETAGMESILRETRGQ